MEEIRGLRRVERKQSSVFAGSKGQLHKIYREHLKLNNKKTTCLKSEPKTLKNILPNNIQMIHEHTRNAPHHVIRKMQIKTAIRYHYIPT